MYNETDVLKRLIALQRDMSELKVLKKEILNFAEVCDYLNVSGSHLYKLTSKREIPCYQPNGKKLYFKRSELDEWLLRNRKFATEDIEVAATNYVLQNSLRKGGRS
jgi:excisionase family DNA binding protein